MKRKKLLRIFFVLIMFEIVIIIGIKGYSIIHSTIIDSSLDENTTKTKKNKKKKSKPTQSENDSSSLLEDELSEDDESNVSLEFTSVDDSYFDDALFIGDSRTVALRAFGAFPNSYFFAKTGISVSSLFEYPASDEVHGVSLSNMLTQRKYSKIYIMIGVNDLSYGNLNTFSDSYFDVIDKIKLFQPDAIIYVQSIVGITKGKELGSPHDFNNQTVINRNAVLKSKCDGESVFYLDLFSAYANSSGYLDSKYSADGLHISPDSLHIWKDYLKNHAIAISE